MTSLTQLQLQSTKASVLAPGTCAADSRAAFTWDRIFGFALCPTAKPSQTYAVKKYIFKFDFVILSYEKIREFYMLRNVRPSAPRFVAPTPAPHTPTLPIYLLASYVRMYVCTYVCTTNHQTSSQCRYLVIVLRTVHSKCLAVPAKLLHLRHPNVTRALLFSVDIWPSAFCFSAANR
jgi:hypothetical protein